MGMPTCSFVVLWKCQLCGSAAACMQCCHMDVEMLCWWFNCLKTHLLVYGVIHLQIQHNDHWATPVINASLTLCFVDRETNLKCRQPLPETGELGDDEEQLSKVKSTALFLFKFWGKNDLLNCMIFYLAYPINETNNHWQSISLDMN